MAQLVDKITCPNPNHADSTPSCAVYDDNSGYCFGCNTWYENLDRYGIYTASCNTHMVVAPADIQKDIEYIEKLNVATLRNLEFPYDDRGYYVVWPDKSYYKVRLWDSPSSKSRYVSPSGHPYRLLDLGFSRGHPLVIIEGEINALSFKKAYPNVGVWSPGSAIELSKAGRWNRSFTEFPSIIVFVDADPAGVAGALNFKNRVCHECPDIRLYTLEIDFNDLLKEGGINAIKEKIESLGVRF